MLFQKMLTIMNETTEEIIRRLEEKGFKKKKTPGMCVYYCKKGEKYTFAVTSHSYSPEEKVIIIVEDALVRKQGYPSITLKPRNDGKGVPYITRKDTGKYEPLHRILVDTELDVDHINSNIYLCISDNLRPCTKKQNNLNTSRVVDIEDVEKGGITRYRYTVEADAKQMRALISLGFVIQSKNKKTGKYTLESPLYGEVVRACQGYTETERILRKGTDMEQFVYDLKNDFSRTLNLLIHYYIFHDITEEEMYEMNLRYWSTILDNVVAA